MAVFVNMVDEPVSSAAAFVARIAGHEIQIGPGAEGRITISSVKAMTLRELLAAFDEQLARNHLIAIKRETIWLIVPVNIVAAASAGPARLAPPPDPPAAAIPQPIAAAAPIATRVRFDGIIYSDRPRAEAMAERLRTAGFSIGVADASQPGDSAYAVVFEIEDSDRARAEFTQRIAALGLDALIALPRRR